MPNLLPPSAQKVQDAFRAQGVESEVIEMASTTRTAAEAAAALGCAVAQIAKSLVFRTRQGHDPVLVIASGANRVDEKRLTALVGESVEKADADYVRQVTGFAIGGVPPIGHSTPLKTFLDEDLLKYETLWAAAGTPHAVIQLTPAQLCAVTSGKVCKVS